MTPAEKLKGNAPQLYYAMLDWKDKNIEAFQGLTGQLSLAECNEDALRSVCKQMVDDAFEVKSANVRCQHNDVTPYSSVMKGHYCNECKKWICSSMPRSLT